MTQYEKDLEYIQEFQEVNGIPAPEQPEEILKRQEARRATQMAHKNKIMKRLRDDKEEKTPFKPQTNTTSNKLSAARNNKIRD